MNTNTTTTFTSQLRSARVAAGLTRAQVAALVGCSISQLANIEQGAVPKESRVLQEALQAIERHKAAA